MLPGYRMIDLSVPLEHASASEPLPAQIRYSRHDSEGLQQMRHFLGVKPEDLVYSNGLGWEDEYDRYFDEDVQVTRKSSSKMAKVKDAATHSVEKTKSAATKVKSGTSSSLRWIKEKVHRRS